MKKLIAILIASALLTQFVPAVAAKPKGSWDAVKTAANRALAVKTKSGKTHFGLVQSIDDSGLKMQLAGRDNMTLQTIDVRRDEVAQVWRAGLRFSEDNIKKAGWIGAGVGTAVIVAIVAANHDSGDAPAGGALFPMLGAGAGAIVGAFWWKKKHKKQELIYSV
jgi:subtilisin family serine protease